MKPEFTGIVLRGYGYQHKPPTANVDHGGIMPHGVYVGFASDGKDSSKEYGRCLCWIYPNTRIAEVFISGFSGDLYNTVLTVDRLEALDKKHLTHMTEAALSVVPPSSDLRYLSDSPSENRE